MRPTIKNCLVFLLIGCAAATVVLGFQAFMTRRIHKPKLQPETKVVLDTNWQERWPNLANPPEHLREAVNRLLQLVRAVEIEITNMPAAPKACPHCGGKL